MNTAVSIMDRLDLTTKDIEMIEAALHTQSKILAVQSEAGGSGAHQKLAELRRLTRRIGRARAPETEARQISLAQIARNLFCVECRATPSG